MKFSRYGIILLTVVCLGFKGNEIIELEGYFNARYSANFLKSTKNVKFVMPPGTRGRVQETKKFSSGNYGLKVELLSGDKKGESVWVYYNTSNPGMRLYASEEELAQDKPMTDVEGASHIKTTKDATALRVPASETAERVIEHVKQGNKAVQTHGKVGGPCADCEVSNVYARDVAQPIGAPTSVANFTPRQSADTPVINPPVRTVNPHGIKPYRCSTKPGNYDLCTLENETYVSRFKFTNRGPNKIVPGTSSSQMRDWSFEYEGGARQDIGFSISDSPNGTISQIQESYFMLFPRKTLPHIRVEGGKQIVTLPTGETVTFNAQTKEVIGGVLSENGPMTTGGKALNPAKISYHGNGVMVRVDAVGNEPRLRQNGQATISKQGRTCKVPVKDLWPDQSQSSAVHFKYFSDSDFDAYLQRKCGFGL